MLWFFVPGVFARDDVLCCGSLSMGSSPVMTCPARALCPRVVDWDDVSCSRTLSPGLPSWEQMKTWSAEASIFIESGAFGAGGHLR